MIHPVLPMLPSILLQVHVSWFWLASGWGCRVGVIQKRAAGKARTALAILSVSVTDSMTMSAPTLE